MDYMLKIGKDFRRSAEKVELTNIEIKLLIKDIIKTLLKEEGEFLYEFEKNQKLYGLYGEIKYLESNTIMLILYIITKTIAINM